MHSSDAQYRAAFSRYAGTVAPLDLVKDLAIILAGIIAVTTFISGVLEYARQGHQTRAQNFVTMRRRFLETPQYREILDLLASDDPGLKDISMQEKRNFVGFLEEVALMVNSKLIRREVAHYMFGYYVLLTARSVHFWEGLDRDSVYWTVFRDLAANMQDMQTETPNVDVLRF